MIFLPINNVDFVVVDGCGVIFKKASLYYGITDPMEIGYSDFNSWISSALPGDRVSVSNFLGGEKYYGKILIKCEQ